MCNDNMNRFIRAAAGRLPAAAGQPEGPTAAQLDRAAELAEQTGCTVREALDLVGVQARPPAPAPAGNAGAGTGPTGPRRQETESERMNRFIRLQGGVL